MAVLAEFKYIREANTVPYPATFENGRTNGGFKDLQGVPEAVSQVHEADSSPALAWLLRDLALSTTWRSLGCDLGQHVEEDGARIRQVTGGYLQFTALDIAATPTDYEMAGEKIFRLMEKRSTSKDEWRVNFEIRPVRYEADDGGLDLGSLWVWFYSVASTISRARAGRERMIGIIRQALCSR